MWSEDLHLPIVAVKIDLLRECSVVAPLLQATDYRNKFEAYAYLWVDDRHEFLRQFLLYGHMVTPEEIEAAGEGGVAVCAPTLEQFREQVDTYETICSEVEKFQVCQKVQLSGCVGSLSALSIVCALQGNFTHSHSRVTVCVCVQGAELFDVWFRVDARPFKQALMNTVKRWSFMFKQHLIDHVTNRSAACRTALAEGTSYAHTHVA